jgi:hypothetical protein
MPRNIEDGTVSIYINELKDGTRYRESGLVLGHLAVIQSNCRNVGLCF